LAHRTAVLDSLVSVPGDSLTNTVNAAILLADCQSVPHLAIGEPILKRARKKTPTDKMPTGKIDEKAKCGLIMPISAIDDLPAAHWEDVKSILTQAIEAAGFEADLVSAAEESTIIHRTIVHNLYNNPLVVCDVSGKNPNVMFELGIRLTFDKPTVVVKDDKTDYSFDSSPIEHLVYPRDLRHNQIMQFMERLTAKVKATHDKAATDPDYSTFLKYFGEFKVPQLEQKEVSTEQFMIARLEELAQSISRLERQSYRSTAGPRRLLEIDLPKVLSDPGIDTLKSYVKRHYRNVLADVSTDNKLRLVFPANEFASVQERDKVAHDLARIVGYIVEDEEISEGSPDGASVEDVKAPQQRS
jgi:hypothetical protein